MKTQNFKPFLENESGPWFDIQETAGLDKRIMNHIDGKMMRQIGRFNIFKIASLSALSVSLIVSGILFGHYLKPTKVVFIYPHSEKVSGVKLVAHFNDNDGVYPMQLDEENGIWKKELHTRNKIINDYAFEVEEIAEND